ncbi:hypothetical protein TNCV_2436121 [Trichonephila clavipes]|nr:hypothetical protein TNCV_2436121 [Trichonephila clavipes]
MATGSYMAPTYSRSQSEVQGDLHRLRLKDIDEVELHMDKASCHTSTSIAVYLAKKESETGIKNTPFDEIPVKSPDGGLMCFRLIKRSLRKTASKNTERTLESGSRGIEYNWYDSTKKEYIHGKFELKLLS